ncbi:glycosyltransferase [Paenibacillus sambharensis]|nr:glycosyltransferase [Paenibacillus sambharensis]
MINQLLPTLSYGDAVSNSAVNMMKVLRSMGLKSNIYAQNIHPKMTKYAQHADSCPKNYPVIYHHSTGSELSYTIPNFTNTKVLVYHNVTPPSFFAGYSGTMQRLCQEGRDQLTFLSEHMDVSIAVSEYNRSELLELGYKNTFISPIIVNYEDYAEEPDQKLLKSLQDSPESKNILFVGRIAPNKKQEDVIKSFYYYHKYINSNSKLTLVGSYGGMERYYSELVHLIEHLQLQDHVVITGHIPFTKILAYYKGSDLFLCMSEHEGFCVPIVEAMYFQLPIIAYKSSAIPDTLGNGGFLTTSKDYKSNAELMHILLAEQELQDKLLANQRVQLQRFSKEAAINQFVAILKQNSIIK